MEFDLIRILFAFLCGHFLCVSGSLSQLVTNNNIASPSTLGMDGVAVLMVIVAQGMISIAGVNVEIEILSFVLFIVLYCAILIRGKFSSLKLESSKNIWQQTNIKQVILLGLTFNLFVGAVFSVIQFMFMALNFEFPSALWFGSFKQVDTNWIFPFVIMAVICQWRLKTLAGGLSKLNLGAGHAQAMGVDIGKLQRSSLQLSLVLTFLVICFFGVFSFLGLIFPHILRSFKVFRTNMRAELLFGPIIAGLILAIIDWFCFNYTYQGAELPVGMVSGVIGSFFLIFLILRAKI
jgi:iron complex transport system permease protein